MPCLRSLCVVLTQNSYNKILTIEASGIAPAVVLGYLAHKNVVFAKKKKPSTMDNTLVTEVFSFTKNTTYQICCSAEFLTKDDKVLFIDDFLANGKAAAGVQDLIAQAGAKLVGMGFLIESLSKRRSNAPRSRHSCRVLATISSLDDCKITFA